MNPLVFRPFRAGDQSEVRALILSGLGDHFGHIDETMNPDLDDIAATYVDRGAYVAVIESDHQIVGVGTLIKEVAGTGRLVRMSVARNQRGRGIGKKLVQHLLAEARNRGYHRVLVETTDDWQDAIGLYRSCEFLTEGFRDGDIHMVLELDISVREETPADIDAIRTVNDLAFASTGEGRLVDRLRSDGLVITSVVAVANGIIVGHALYSELPIETVNATIQGVALAPVAVLPEWQRRGVGSAVIRMGLELCQARGCAAVVVLGHPDYYPRFGFSTETAVNLQSPYSGPAFMALELQPGSISGGGVVIYPEAFSLVE